MDLFPAVATNLLLLGACLGMGAALLRALGVDGEAGVFTRLAWSFPVGFGALGWVIFFPAAFGFLTPPVLFTVCAAGCAGLYFLVRRSGHPTPWARPDTVGWLLIAVLVFILFFDLMEGLSPPSDADTLAYHFTLPKRHLAAGGLVFIPRAVDGILPQLIHMTYTAALGLGGETGLTLWTMLSGWGTATLLYELCRRYVGMNWALAVAILYLSTPTVLQTGGAGYVEPRAAQFVMIAAVAAGIAIQRDDAAYARLSGLCAGFFAASKYTGLLFCLAVGLVMLAGRGRWKRVSWFGLFALVAGIQWYVWIFLKTGDPVFPMLYGILGAKPGLWSAAQDEVFRGVLAREAVIARSLWGFIAYPFYATFSANPVFEGGRTGFGILPLMLAPFALGWAVTGWRRDLRSPLLLSGVVIALYYAFWFFGGTPQRVRYLLPVLPVLLLCLAVPAVRWAMRFDLRGPLIAGLVMCIGVQAAGQTVFGRNYAFHVLSGESRAAFLQRNISYSVAVSWYNEHRRPGDRLLVLHRELLYLVDPPVVLSHPLIQRVLNVRRANVDPAAFYRELRNGSVTHILFVGGLAGERENATLDRFLSVAYPGLWKIAEAGCLREVYSRKIPHSGSRTLKSVNARQHWAAIFRLTEKTCRL